LYGICGIKPLAEVVIEECGRIERMGSADAGNVQNGTKRARKK
jgi:hypothetical protein